MDGQRRKRIRTIQGRLAGKGDQALREFRDVYEGLDDHQKRSFVDALGRVADANEILRALPIRLHAAIETQWISRDDDGEVVGAGHAELSPKVLLKAIRAWSQGQGYSPGGLGFVY